MKQPFKKEEISKVAKKLNNGRSSGSDELKQELIKYAPIDIHHENNKIFNNVASKGDGVVELTLCVKPSLQKPGKSKGPPEKLRPMILLFFLRKLLTICMIQRPWDHL